MNRLRAGYDNLFARLSMPPKINGPLLAEIVRMLRDHGKVDRIVKGLKARGMKEYEARELVLQVRSQLRWQIRKAGIIKIVVSLVIFLATIPFLFTGIIFYVAIPFSLLGFIWGIIQVIFAVEDEEDKPYSD
jgi:hypothetical protein